MAKGRTRDADRNWGEERMAEGTEREGNIVEITRNITM